MIVCLKTCIHIIIVFIKHLMKSNQDGRGSAIQHIQDVSMTYIGQSHKEARVQNESLANPKVTRRIGTWNVRTMYATGKSAQVMREMRRYHLDILGISECRWTGSGKIRTQTGETIIYSGRPDDHHSNGVAIAMKGGNNVT